MQLHGQSWIIDDTSGPDRVDATCAALGMCRASYDRTRKPLVHGPRDQVGSPRSLLPDEQPAVVVFHPPTRTRFPR